MKALCCVAGIVVLAAGCKYAASIEGDAKRESDAKQVETFGAAASSASALLPPPFNLIAASAAGVVATIAAQKIRSGKTQPPAQQ